VTSRRSYLAKGLGKGLGKGLSKGIKVDLRSALAQPVEEEEPHFVSPKSKPTVKEHALNEDDDDLAYENLKAGGGQLGKQKYEQKLQAAVKKQLSLAQDPFHIAQHVSQALARGSFDEALLMTRTASRNKKVEVSWNHLIDYQMKNRRLHAAVKLYNEVRIYLSACLVSGVH
jgi:pentatricopeptide repeat protein